MCASTLQQQHIPPSPSYVCLNFTTTTHLSQSKPCVLQLYNNHTSLPVQAMCASTLQQPHISPSPSHVCFNSTTTTHLSQSQLCVLKFYNNHTSLPVQAMCASTLQQPHISPSPSHVCFNSTTTTHLSQSQLSVLQLYNNCTSLPVPAMCASTLQQLHFSLSPSHVCFNSTTIICVTVSIAIVSIALSTAPYMIFIIYLGNYLRDCIFVFFFIVFLDGVFQRLIYITMDMKWDLFLTKLNIYVIILTFYVVNQLWNVMNVKQISPSHGL